MDIQEDNKEVNIEDGYIVVVQTKDSETFKTPLMTDKAQAQRMLDDLCKTVREIDMIGETAFFHGVPDVLIEVHDIKRMAIKKATKVNGQLVSQFAADYWRKHGKIPSAKESMDAMLGDVCGFLGKVLGVDPKDLEAEIIEAEEAEDLDVRKEET